MKIKREQKGRGAQKEKSSDASEAQAGQGRGEEAQQHAVWMLRWRISEAGIHVFPGTAEFMRSQELKKPLS